jgi:hypothetical protein
MSEQSKDGAEQLRNLRNLLDEEDALSESLLADVEAEFGHPMNWPLPPRCLPRWYQPAMRRRVRNLETWFGPLSQEDLDAFWNESSKGQSVYEDSGGYRLRCYRALVALHTDEPYTYEQAFDAALASREG